MQSAKCLLPGHPDKVCDLVVEAIIDEYLKRDPETRIQIHAMGGRGALFIAGDVKSKADFDVSSLVRRTLGTLSVMCEVEPFISIEPVGSEQSQLFSNGPGAPVAVSAYATSETEEMLPPTVATARRVAALLDEKRQNDENWFWLGPDGEVMSERLNNDLNAISIRVEHGSLALEEARKKIISAVNECISGSTDVLVNESGPCEMRGLAERMGASGKDVLPYGFALPAVYLGVGLDPKRPEKGGAWLARQAARALVKRGAKAVLVQAVYLPGEFTPSVVQARDERGRDVSKDVDRKKLSLERIALEWWRPNLNFDAARLGFAGGAGMPWEE
ncbi:MAG: S-adenosylmethionine synthetase N-terminal domain-containing protein [Patescibacteria group bacterium]